MPGGVEGYPFRREVCHPDTMGDGDREYCADKGSLPGFFFFYHREEPLWGGGWRGVRGRRIIRSLALVVWPFVTHLFRDRAALLLMMEIPPTFRRS